MSKEQVLYGSEERKSKRALRVDRVRKKLQLMLIKHIPSFQTGVPNVDEYSLKMPELLQDVEAQFPSMSDFRDARNHLAYFINQGNEAKKWDLDVPPYITRVRREKPLRTQRWFKNTRTLFKIYTAWSNELLNLNSTSVEARLSPKDMLADVLISAAFHGALCRSVELTSLANLLITESKPITRAGDRVYLDLPHGNGKNEIRRWFPDSLSLACIHKYLSFEFDDVKVEQLSNGACWRLISGRLADVGNTKITVSYESFCRSAIGVTESLPGVDLSQVLVEYAIGTVSSTSLPKEHMSLLVQKEFNKNLSMDISGLKFIPSATKISHRRRTSNDCNYARLIRGGYTALCVYQRPGVKNTANNAKEQIRLLCKSEELPFAVLVLLDWLISLLLRPLSISTVRR
jgi:hypothetical protein